MDHEGPGQKNDLSGLSWCIWPKVYMVSPSGGIDPLWGGFGGVKNGNSALSEILTPNLVANFSPIYNCSGPQQITSIGGSRSKLPAEVGIFKISLYRKELWPIF